MDKVKIAVVGAGYIGLAHIDCLQHSATCELSAIVDLSPTAEAVAAKRGVALFKMLDELIAQSRPDGIVLATPNMRPRASGPAFRYCSKNPSRQRLRKASFWSRLLTNTTPAF